MSHSQVASDRLHQRLSDLIPSLLASLSDLRQANRQQQQLLPFSHIHDAFKPLVDTQAIGEDFGLAVNLSSADKDGPEVRTRNLCLEISNNELRKVVLEDASGLVASQEQDLDDDALQLQLVSTLDRLDAILVLSLHDLVDPSLPLSLIEELIEGQPISTCSRLFAYTESRVQPLTIDLHPTRGKGLVLLRTCNELLRRLSKPSQQHTVFAGRILSLLAKVFPLGERSGVNLRGEFNVENKTHIEDRAQDADEDAADGLDEKDEVFKVDYEFYELFWKVQRFFSNPPLLMGASDSSRPSTRNTTPAEGADVDHANLDKDPAPDGAKGAMAELRISTAKILKLFGAVTKREKELAGAAKAEEAKYSGSKGGASRAASGSATPLSNKRNNDNGTTNTGYIAGNWIGQKRDEPPRKRARPDIVDGVSTHSADADEEMAEQVSSVEEAEADAAERGHFFPTYLTGRKLFEYEIRDTSFRKHILVQYFVLFQYLLSFTPLAKESWKDWKNKTLQALFTLEDADERWIRSTWREIQGLIREIQPDGRLFLESVLEVLKREANWIRWKTESCPSIEKPPLSPEQIAQFASARALLLRKPEPYPHKLGTAALSELWQDGLRPPVPGTRRVENEMGEYVTIATDGLEELEFLPPIPSLEHYNKSIQREKMKLDLRKKQLGIDAAVGEAQLSKEEREKLDKDERVQATIESMQSLAWRALRVASRDNLHLFGKPDRPEDVEGLLQAMEEERNPKPKAVAPAVQPQAANEGEGASKATEEEGAASDAEAGTEKVSAKAEQGSEMAIDSATSTTKVEDDPSSVAVSVEQPLQAADDAATSTGTTKEEAEGDAQEKPANPPADQEQDVDMSEAA
ncbi:related to nuclear matrix protein p84 [Sporisorium reilianum f. sp. reilianum]|uniref:Related to nuclear matrix protein p84 n=1 Tax=Sporisorium reilianum f. sp. reilianum TaxID=72559 RepID=A0A2N8UIM2_9BASI|nr:related to nuclear matrix protein p84 [Sporisorium reilianum f. sp. reilianum]